MTRKPHRIIQDPVMKLEIPHWYGNVPTFFGAPLAQNAEDLREADIVFLGIPWQAPTPDSRMGPAADIFMGMVMTAQSLRTSSVKYGGYLPELDVDVFDHLSLVDYGNVDVVRDIRQTNENAVVAVENILSAGAIPVTVGGNSGLGCLPVLEAISRHSAGPIAVINFDAHGDNRDYSTPLEIDNGRPRISGNWALRQFDLSNVSARHYHHVGLRGPRNDSGTIPRFLSRGVLRDHIYTYREIKTARRTGFDEFAAQIVNRAMDGASHLWLAIDADVLDIGVCPGFGDEPLGVSVEELVEICYQAGRIAGRKRLAGISLMAIPPGATEMQWISIYTILYTLAGMLQENGIE